MADRHELMYPPVGVEFLRSEYARNPVEVDRVRSQWFEIGATHNPLPAVENAVSISLFRAHIDNTFPHERDLDEDAAARWMRKYYEPLAANLRWFEEGFDTRHWKIVAYVCPNSLAAQAPERNLVAMIAACPFVELHVMSSPTVGHGPGALWRFLSMADRRLDRLLVFDIDDSWADPVNRWHLDAERFEKPYSRAVHMPRKNFWLDIEHPWRVADDGSVVNYPAILASKQLVRPRQLKLPDVDVLMSAYAVLRMERARSPNPVSQLDDDEPSTPYNQPFENYRLGWGNHWFQYCFDERFLKHVIYPYAVTTGSMCTYCLPQTTAPDLAAYLARPTLRDFLADFRSTQAHPGNVIVTGGDRYEGKL